MASPQTAFWRALHKEAWTLSQEHFSWVYQLGVTGLVGLVTFVITWYVNGLDQAMDNYLVPSVVAGVATVLTAAGIYVWNLVRAGAQIHAQNLSAISRIDSEKQMALAERDEARKQNQSDAKALRELEGLRAELAVLRAQNLGIDFRVSELKLICNEEGLDGVMVAVSVDRLVNRNQTDASLEIVLRAPILVPGAGTTTFAIGVGPESEPAHYVKASAPQLCPPVHVPAKRNTGPSYMLFNFRQSELLPFPFEPLWKNRTADELMTAIFASEMFFEVTDIANGAPTERFDAPGTREKALARRSKQSSGATR